MSPQTRGNASPVTFSLAGLPLSLSLSLLYPRKLHPSIANSRTTWASAPPPFSAAPSDRTEWYTHPGTGLTAGTVTPPVLHPHYPTEKGVVSLIVQMTVRRLRHIAHLTQAVLLASGREDWRDTVTTGQVATFITEPLQKPWLGRNGEFSHDISSIQVKQKIIHKLISFAPKK